MTDPDDKSPLSIEDGAVLLRVRLEAWTAKRLAVRAFLGGRGGSDVASLIGGLVALLEKSP